jgi:hypothetical protein
LSKLFARGLTAISSGERSNFDLAIPLLFVAAAAFVIIGADCGGRPPKLIPAAAEVDGRSERNAVVSGLGSGRYGSVGIISLNFYFYQSINIFSELPCDVCPVPAPEENDDRSCGRA